MSSRPVVIAHRGASGYLPEHTLAAKTLAYAMGADFLEQDVVATRDDELVVLHDIHLDRTTNVAEVFPDRARTDGRYYVRDFDIVELRELHVWERFDEDGQPVYPKRYPPRSGHFRINTLREELDFVEQLNEDAERPVGIYPEIKKPAWHRDEGVDVTPIMLEMLREFGYRSKDDPVYVQCFDPTEVLRIREELGCELRLIQLIADNSWQEAEADYDELLSETGLDRLRGIADGIGPWFSQLYVNEDGPRSTGVVEAARERGLHVHPYTFRADDLPQGFSDFDELLAYAIEGLKVDGLFTDFPDLARRAIDNMSPAEQKLAK